MPRSPRLRRLRPDEIELWLGVAESVVRRAGSTLPERLAAPAGPVVLPPSPPPPPPSSRPSRTPPPLAPLEPSLRRRLSRGIVAADAAIDLHGFRQAEAHAALRRFLHRAQSDGARVVLVVTGKGGGARPADASGGLGDIARETGVLRRAVPLWLAMPELRPLVVGYEEAGRAHGGSGALYVRLRRRERT